MTEFTDQPPIWWPCPKCGGVEYEAIAVVVLAPERTPQPGEANVDCRFHYRPMEA